MDSPHPWRWRILTLCWLSYAALYLGRVNLAVALPAIQAEFGWSRAALGLVGSALYWSYAIGQLVNGHLGERASARALVALGMCASALLNLAFGVSGALAGMVALWAANGWAQSTGWAPMVKTLSRWFPPRQRGLITALFSPCYLAGHALSWALAGWLVMRAGWRAAFWAPGLILLAWAAGWALLARDAPERVRAPLRLWTGERDGRFRLSDLAETWRQPALRWGLTVCLLSGIIKEGLALWAPSYLVQAQGLPLERAALAAMWIPLAGGLGAMGSGWLLRAWRRSEGPVVALLTGLLVAVTLALWLARATTATWVAVGLLAALALASHGINALLMTALPLSLGPGGRVSAAAGTLDFASYVGAGLSGALSGWLQDQWGWGALFLGWLVVALALAALTVRKRVE